MQRDSYLDTPIGEGSISCVNSKPKIIDQVADRERVKEREKEEEKFHSFPFFSFNTFRLKLPRVRS